MRNSILSVTTAATSTILTTLTRLKLELGISGSGSDTLLTAFINEASEAVTTYLKRTLASETVVETIWLENDGNNATISLSRYPAVVITSIVENDVTLVAADYRLDADTGIIYRMESGCVSSWVTGEDIVVTYSAGYVLPSATSGRTLPYPIEKAVLMLCGMYYYSAKRDPLVKSEDIPQLGRVDYWVGSIGTNGSLPPPVIDLIAPYRMVTA